MNAFQIEAGSCRDRSSSVLHRDGGIYRALRQEAVPGWNRLRDSRLFARRTADGSLVQTREVSTEEAGFTPPEGSQVLLHHQRIPFISYPYEWCFQMLKDAARLTLDLLCEALDEKLTLRDATPTTCSGREPGRSSDLRPSAKPSPGCGWDTANSASSSSTL